MGLTNAVYSKVKTVISAACGRATGQNLVPAMITVNVAPVAQIAPVAAAADNQVGLVAVAADNQVAPVAAAANNQVVVVQGANHQGRLAKRNTKSQPKFPVRGDAKFGLVQTDRELTLTEAKVVMSHFEEQKAHVAQWSKALAIFVRQVYSRAGEDTPDWLMEAHGLSAKEPGSRADKVERYFMFGTFVPSEKLAVRLVKYIKFHTTDDWNDVPPEATARYFTRMKKCIKTFETAEKQALLDGTEIPDDIVQSMRWDQEEQEDQEEDQEEQEDQEEEDGSMEDNDSTAGSEDSEEAEGSEEEEDSSAAGSDDSEEEDMESEEEDLDTKPKARVSVSP